MSAAKNPSQSNIPLAVLAFLLAIFCCWLVLTSLHDISDKMYKYQQPIPVKGLEWAFLVIQGLSTTFCLMVGVASLRDRKCWYGWGLLAVFLLNIGLLVYQLFSFFSSWGGTSFG